MDSRQIEIVEEFALFSDWSERYQYLIDLGKRLPVFAESDRTDVWRVMGCQSMVWLKPSGDRTALHFAATSDSAIVRGLIALVLRVYSGRSAEEILATDAEFVERIGLSGHLSPTRKNGLAAMLKRIREYASATVAGA